MSHAFLSISGNPTIKYLLNIILLVTCDETDLKQLRQIRNVEAQRAKTYKGRCIFRYDCPRVSNNVTQSFPLSVSQLLVCFSLHVDLIHSHRKLASSVHPGKIALNSSKFHSSSTTVPKARDGPEWPGMGRESCLGGYVWEIVINSPTQTLGSKGGIPKSWGSTVFKKELQKSISDQKQHVQLLPLHLQQ